MRPLPDLHSDPDLREALLQGLRASEASDKFVAEVRRKLSKFESQTVERAIEILVDRDALNDERTARNAIEKGLQRKGYGKRRVRQDLLFRGAEETIVDACLAEFEDEDQLDAMRKLLEKRPAKDTPEKATRFLASRGFEYEAIREAIAAKFNQESDV